MNPATDIAEYIKDAVNEVLLLKASYSYPLRDVPKPYPALLVLYDGFSRPEEEDDMNSYVHDIRYNLTLYLDNDGRNMEERWDSLNELVWELVKRFANDRTLGRNCRQSLLVSGEPVVHLNDAKIPVGLGHTFVLMARIETEEE
jgi:hypothetical protein